MRGTGKADHQEDCKRDHVRQRERTGRVPWHDKVRVDRSHHFIDIREPAGFEDDERGHDTDTDKQDDGLDNAGPCNRIQAADRCVNGNDQRGDDEREPERDLENGDKDDRNRRILPDKVDERDDDAGNRGERAERNRALVPVGEVVLYRHVTGTPGNRVELDTKEDDTEPDGERDKDLLPDRGPAELEPETGDSEERHARCNGPDHEEDKDPHVKRSSRNKVVFRVLDLLRCPGTDGKHGDEIDADNDNRDDVCHLIMPLKSQSPVEQCSCNDKDNASYSNDGDIWQSEHVIF